MFTGVPSLVKTYALEEATAENNASGDAVCPGHSASRAEIGRGSASATLLRTTWMGGRGDTIASHMGHSMYIYI